MIGFTIPKCCIFELIIILVLAILGIFSKLAIGAGERKYGLLIGMMVLLVLKQRLNITTLQAFRQAPCECWRVIFLDKNRFSCYNDN